MAEQPGEDFGPYRLEEVIGRGGMGVVYRAYDTRRDRTVALKRLPREMAADEHFQARFRRESRLAARLNEPHIIPIHDFGEHDGQLFIDMRLVEGLDLSKLITDEGGALGLELAVDIIVQVSAALSAAHNAGLMHRDIKPSNVLISGVTREDRTSPFAYLVDFGIARAIGNEGTALTSTTDWFGTVAYMAPERISGSSGDSRSDIYSLACLLYQCLTGQAPFTGEALQVLFAHVNNAPPSTSEKARGIPPGLDAAIRRGMAKKPDDRYQTVAQFASAVKTSARDSNATTGTVPLVPGPGIPGGPPHSFPPQGPRQGPAQGPRQGPQGPQGSQGPRQGPQGPSQGSRQGPPQGPQSYPPRGGQAGPPHSNPPRSGPPQSFPPRAAQAGPPQSFPPRPPQAGPPHSVPPRAPQAGPPQSIPPRSGPPQTSVPPHRAGPPNSIPPRGPQGGTQTSVPPRGGQSHTSPPHAGPPHAGPPHSVPPRGPQSTGGNGNALKIMIALAAIVVLAAIIAVIVAVSGDDSTNASGAPSGTGVARNTPISTSRAITTGSGGATWAEPYRNFTTLIGAAPGSTSTAYRGATCALQGPDQGVTGMIDQVSCTKLSGGSKVVYYVGRFTGKSATDAYLAERVTQKYNRKYWTIDEKNRGEIVTSPTSLKYADITTSICDTPEFLVQFYAEEGSGVTITALQSDYWKESTFPDATPAICS